MTEPSDADAIKRVTIELPDWGVTASLKLYTRAAPTVTNAIHRALETPLESMTSHACFDGHEVFCFLPPFARRPPLENRSMRPDVGEVMFFYAAEHEFACMSDSRLSARGFPMCELAFMYGRVDLRYLTEEGLVGSLVGRVDRGFDGFADACAATLTSGATRIRLVSEAPARETVGASALPVATTLDKRT